MKKYLFIIFLVISFSLFCSAQDNEIVKQQIGDIKLNDAYVFGESCHVNENNAEKSAIADLFNSINGIYIFSNDTNSIRRLCKKLVYTRGDIICVFLFAKISSFEELSMNAYDTSTTSIIRQADASRNEDVDLSQVGVSNGTFEREVLTNVLEREMLENVWGYLSNMKDFGRIKSLEKAKSINEIPSDSYIVIYNRKYKIVAVLMPEKDGLRRNVKNNQPDRLSNYSGNGAIWYNL